jgi:hypothetical protein
MEKYDVFICHNSKDKPEVGKIKSSLQSQGINTFYDEDNLIPFKEWEKQILDSISEVKAFLVFISNNGTGKIQHKEINFFLKKVLRKKPEIQTGLVILMNTQEGMIDTVKNAFPKLQKYQYCDFRKEESNPMNKLISAITGRDPESQSIFFYDSEEEFTFDISAHKGHLPVLIEDYQEIIIDIFARIEACPQFNKDPLKLLNSHLGFQPDTSAIKAVEIINSLTNI